MQRNDEPFTPETVDEQIDVLEENLHQMPRGHASPPAVRMLDQLQREFGEDGADERSVDAVWERLLRQQPPQLRRQDTLGQEERQSRPPGRAGGLTMGEPARPRRSMTTRLLALVAAVVLVAVVGGLVAGLVLVRHPHSFYGGIDVGTSTTTAPRQSPTVYAYQEAVGTRGSLVALDAQTGREYWQVEESSVIPALAQGDGVLYASTVSDMILAYRASDGSLLWQYPAGGSIYGLQFAQGVLYITVDGKGLLSLGSNGHLLWLAPVKGHVYRVQDGLIYLDSFYVLNASDGSIRLHAQNVNGILLAIVGQQVYALDEKQSVLYALDAQTYTERWRFTQRSFYLNFIGANQQAVYVTSYQGASGPGPDTIYALNASDGSVRWQHPTQERGSVVELGILLGTLAQGVVYLGGISGTAYAFDASTGKLLWQVQGRYGDALMVINGVVIYAYGSEVPQSGVFSALNASDGSLRWQKRTAVIQVFNLGTYLLTLAGDQTPVILALKVSDGTQLWSYRPANEEESILYIFVG